VILNGEKQKAMADQMTTVSKLRLLEQLGVLSNIDMNKIGDAIKIQLNLV
jgi:mRNA interferase MazF